jgi:DeoR/GlpR family transcriptional regulator of sugar metabolism
LHDGHAAVATDLAREFDVSEDAIRRDLRALAAEGRCTRVYGGALPLSAASTSIEVRSRENLDRKRALAAVAVTLIKPDEFVFIDSGSANLALAGMLSQCKGISVATNSVTIAAAVLAHRIPLVMVGGAVNPDIGGCVDTAAVRAVQQLNVDRCFLGTCAVSLAEGVGAFAADDAAFKRALLEVSRKTMVLATNDKLETRARYRVAPLKRINTLVVDHDAAVAAPKLIAKAASMIVTASAGR